SRFAGRFTTACPRKPLSDTGSRDPPPSGRVFCAVLVSLRFGFGAAAAVVAPEDSMSVLDRLRDRAAPFRDVLAFNFRHWARQKRVAVFIAVGVMLMTAADVLLPVYVGRLIDALSPVAQTSDAATRTHALREAFAALVAMVGLGLLMLVTRH